jgi:ribosomal protein S13
MKEYKYKIMGLLVLLAVSVQAQKFDKTIKEKFKVNSDVEVVINATHTDVEIETWNKNEVAIEAVIEVEGVSKKEAEKILEKWKFEALGNKKKVKIASLSTNFDFKFDFDFDFPDIDVPHFEMPELPEMPEMAELPEMPEMDFEVYEFDYDTYKKDSSYLKGYKMKVAKQVKKFKDSDWMKKFDSVRNSDEYKLKMIEFKKASATMAKEMKEFKNSEEFKLMIEESKRVAEEVRKEMLDNKDLMKDQMRVAKEASRKAKEMIKKMKEEGKFEAMRKHGENVYFFNENDKNSKVKIKKYIKIKVPKNATFDLNVRHGKLNVPKSNKKMSAKISYGNFIGGIISGEKNELNLTNSPVNIQTINSSNITLKNVPNATFGTFENSNLFANSSDVVIYKVGKDVALSQKFGKLEVKKLIPNFNKLNLILDYAKATLNFSDAQFVYKINDKKSTLKLGSNLTEVNTKTVDGIRLTEGFSVNKTSSNKLFLTSVFSTFTLN